MSAHSMKHPTMEEVQFQAVKMGLPEPQAQQFFYYYESNGWKVGKNPMRNWVMALAGWKLRWEERRGIGANGSEVARKILAEKELARVEQRLREIKGSYDAHQAMDDRDRGQFVKLAARKKELKALLGFSA